MWFKFYTVFKYMYKNKMPMSTVFVNNPLSHSQTNSDNKLYWLSWTKPSLTKKQNLMTFYACLKHNVKNQWTTLWIKIVVGGIKPKSCATLWPCLQRLQAAI